MCLLVVEKRSRDLLSGPGRTSGSTAAACCCRGLSSVRGDQACCGLMAAWDTHTRTHTNWLGARSFELIFTIMLRSAASFLAPSSLSLPPPPPSPLLQEFNTPTIPPNSLCSVAVSFFKDYGERGKKAFDDVSRVPKRLWTSIWTKFTGKKSSCDEGAKLSMNFMEGLNVAQQQHH